MQTTDLDLAQELLGHTFHDRELLEQALTHASIVETRLDSNERLEFLGDAVLGLVICAYLFANYEELAEGEMTKIKSAVVSRQTCAAVARELKLAELLRLGKGIGNRATLPGSVLAAVYEALIGALYLDAGLEITRRFILRNMESRIAKAAGSGHQQNFKSLLQQCGLQQFGQAPQYIVLDEQGPDHAKCFEICVEIGARRFKPCWGPSKKQAEQLAALEALVELGVAERVENGEVRLRAREPVDSAVN